jgi:hypothetical protein
MRDGDNSEVWCGTRLCRGTGTGGGRFEGRPAAPAAVRGRCADRPRVRHPVRGAAGRLRLRPSRNSVHQRRDRDQGRRVLHRLGQPGAVQDPDRCRRLLGAPQTLALSGPASAVLGIFNLNGIEATPNGDTLIVAHTPLGALFTVDPRTGASREVELTGGALVPGTPDGLLLDGHTIWVVQNFANQVAEIRLSPDLSSGRVVDQITNADVHGAFRIPTTIAEHGDRLAIVNSRFDLGLPPPLGTGVPPGTDYDVALVRKP